MRVEEKIKQLKDREQKIFEMGGSDAVEKLRKRETDSKRAS